MQDQTRQDKTVQGRAKQDTTRQERTRQDKTRQDKTRQDRTGQDRIGQDRTGQDRTGTSQDGTRQAKPRQDKTDAMVCAFHVSPVLVFSVCSFISCFMYSFLQRCLVHVLLCAFAVCMWLLCDIAPLVTRFQKQIRSFSLAAVSSLFAFFFLVQKQHHASEI